MKEKYQIVVVGGGPAGLSAAVSAYDEGVTDVLVIEREETLGGILNQCIHNGFGLARFKESLTGPEYAERYIQMLQQRGIEFCTQTTVLSVTKDKKITAVNAERGVFTVQADAVVLAMGCRERSRGALNIAGTRPSGVFSAGTAQKLVNVKGYMPGKRVVILGSGDIGLIMARRMTLEGAKVLAVAEILPRASGLKRNVVQCLDDFSIPLYLSHTVTQIEGEERIEGVMLSQVDENRNPIAGTEKHFACDTLLLSVGLIPENELSKDAEIPLSTATKGAIVYQTRETLVDGVFACGNVLQVHDLVDFVSEESAIAGKYSAKYVQNPVPKTAVTDVRAGEGVAYVLPQKIDLSVAENVKLFFRVKDVRKESKVVIKDEQKTLVSIKKRAMLPAEMETIVLPWKLLSSAVGTVSVSVEDEE